MDWPTNRLPAPTIMSPFHPDSLGIVNITDVLAGAASATLTANKAYYFPFTLFDWATVYQLLLLIGATSSGNIDVGIYDDELNRILSAGSTAMSGTTDTVQEINVADTELPPGNYYIAVVVDNATGTVHYNAINDDPGLSKFTVLEEASAFPLPATATPVLCTDSAVPIIAVGAQLFPTF